MLAVLSPNSALLGVCRGQGTAFELEIHFKTPKELHLARRFP
jgi:hypothetical protein